MISTKQEKGGNTSRVPGLFIDRKKMEGREEYKQEKKAQEKGCHIPTQMHSFI